MASAAYLLSIVDLEISVECKPTPVLFFQNKKVALNFNNMHSDGTEKMIYITGHGWRRVKFGYVFDSQYPTYYVDINYKHTAVLFID